MDAPASASNRLIGEKSPYLLQHAHNPVDWYPWGEEAFGKAKAEDKPVFLSVGYSTCHWCHVMARESFEDPAVAAALNSGYVAVKVDREERPDIDHVYMKVCQMLTGSGGWPLTVIMTPDKKPFFAGTYFPKRSRFGLPGLLDLLEAIAASWKDDRATLTETARKVSNALAGGVGQAARRERRVPRGEGPDAYREVADKAFEHLTESFDEANGGFGTAPKFPSAHGLLFLLRYWRRTGRRKALEMAEKTLRRTYAGGIYDHIGFGFFRYSTDARWLVPHFEKMLYDNAMMMMAYVELHLATGRERYRDVAYQIVEFLGSDFKAPEGAFWSAIDAESEGEEGRFYLWTPDEVVRVLGEGPGRAYCRNFGITPEGNFRGRSIPNLGGVWERSRERRATEEEPVFGQRRQKASPLHADDGEEDAVPERTASSEELRRKLCSYRSGRARPAVDDKVLTSWNSLAAAALAKTGRAFGDGHLVDAARGCLAFLERELVRDGRVFARYRDGEVAFPGYLDDHAFLAWAYIEMHQATGETAFLDKAADVVDAMLRLFWDEAGKGFYLSSKDSETLMMRPKEVWDGALPSGNSVAVMDLLRLSHLLHREDYEEKGLETIDALRDPLRREPTGLLHLVSAAMYAGSARDVTIHGRRDDPTVNAMLKYISGLYLPDTQVVPATDEGEGCAAATDGRTAARRPWAQICRGRTCTATVSSVEELQRALIDPGMR